MRNEKNETGKQNKNEHEIAENNVSNFANREYFFKIGGNHTKKVVRNWNPIQENIKVIC